MITFVVSDSHDCDDFDLELIARTAKQCGAKRIIHCGDMIDAHLGSPFFSDFEIYVYLTTLNKNIPAKLPPNWHLLDDKNRIIEINPKFRIYVNHYMGINVHYSIDVQSRTQTNIPDIVEQIHKQYGYVAYALFGHSHNHFATSEHGTGIVNPGAWIEKLCWAVINTKTWGICLDTHTHNFERVPFARKSLEKKRAR